MKTNLLTYALLIIAFILPIKVGAKGDGGVGFWMEGTITELKTDGDKIYFKLKGEFWFEQYEGVSPSLKKITVDGRRGISVTVHQNDPFFAFTTDWKGGAIREAGGLLRIIKAATQTGNCVRFQLVEPTIVFDSEHRMILSNASVIRATDADLR